MPLASGGVDRGGDHRLPITQASLTPPASGRNAIAFLPGAAATPTPSGEGVEQVDAWSLRHRGGKGPCAARRRCTPTGAASRARPEGREACGLRAYHGRMSRLAAIVWCGAGGVGGARAKPSGEALRVHRRIHARGPERIIARALGQKAVEAGHSSGDREPARRRGNIPRGRGKERPDGYTWLAGQQQHLATNRASTPGSPYDPVRDFAPVALVAIQPNILVVNPRCRPRTVRELIALAKSEAGAVNYASSAQRSRAPRRGAVQGHGGLDMVHVPYKGAQAGAYRRDAGQAQLMFATRRLRFPTSRPGAAVRSRWTTSRRSAAARSALRGGAID